jgi:hypothetical protein
MRAFLVACLAVVVVGAGGYFFLASMQESSGVTYTTNGARITTNWSWRSVGNRGGECVARRSWQWVFVDFGKPEGESATCSISQ